jgi:DNA-directed RNA polymerase subunit RPC12/RpoP
MEACSYCGKRVYDGVYHSAKMKLSQHSSHEKKMEACPYCGKRFYDGVYHSAKMKLSQHLSDAHSI